MVDLCNAVSLAFSLPVAIFDIEVTESFIEERYGLGNEEYLDFSGETERFVEDEVVFVKHSFLLSNVTISFNPGFAAVLLSRNKEILIVIHDPLHFVF